MKKKFFMFSLLIVALVLVFAFAVNAETVVSDGNIDENGEIVADYVGNYTIDNSTQTISSIDITYTDVNGETKTGKMYFASNVWGNYRQMYSTYIPQDFDMSQTVYMPDKIDVNGDGSFAYNEKITGTQGQRNLYYKYSTFDEGVFTDLVDVKKQLKKLSYSAYLEYFGPDAYHAIPLETVTYNGREAVDGTFFVSPAINMFYGGGSDSSFGGNANGNINGATGKFKRLIFEERTNSVSFGQYCFCRNEIEEVVFLGTGKYNLRDDAIAYLYYEGTSTPCLKRVVIQDGVTFTKTISDNVGTYDVVFIGDEASYDASNYSSCLTNATGNVIFEEICYVYGHKADEDDGDCTTALLCADCGTEMLAKQDAHASLIDWTYDGGFFKSGVYTCDCTNEGCTAVDGTQSKAPLFYWVGYSTKTYGDYSFGQQYIINTDVLNEYRAYLKSNGTLFSYGVVAAGASSNGQPLSVVDGAVTNKDGSEFITFDNISYDAFFMNITGMKEENLNKGLVCCAYVVLGDEVVYLDGGETVETVVLKSYNDIVAIVGSKEDEE